MLVHSCPISTYHGFSSNTWNTRKCFPLLVFIYKVKYVDNWGTVFLSNALMFIKCPGVSISINDNRNASATFLRAVGNLILNNEICSLPVRIDCVAMKPEWRLFFSGMENTFILLYSIQSSEWRHTGSCALAVFLLVLFFFGMPSRRLSKGKRCYNWMATLLLHDTHY